MAFEISTDKYLMNFQHYLHMIERKPQNISKGNEYIKAAGAHCVHIKQQELAKLWEIDRKEKAEIIAQTKHSRNGLNFYGSSVLPRNSDLFFEMMYRDLHTEGMVWNFPHGNIIMQGLRGHYYRGEATIYPTSTSSLVRRLSKLIAKERRYEVILARLRLIEFENLLNQLPFIREWNGNHLGKVWVEAIAQHYGFPTFFLDITNDFATAMLFATCQYDRKTGSWLPLVSKRTSSTGYGVIYHATHEEMENVLLRKTKKINVQSNRFLQNMIYPIGFQPFNRCSNQYGFVMYMPENAKPLNKSTLFERLIFKQCEKLSKEVLKRTDGGRNIYPDEPVKMLEPYYIQIRDSYRISVEAWEKLCQEFSSIMAIKSDLEQYVSLQYGQTMEWAKDSLKIPKCCLSDVDEACRKASPLAAKKIFVRGYSDRKQYVISCLMTN